LSFRHRFVRHEVPLAAAELDAIAATGWELVCIPEHETKPISIWKRPVGHPFSIQKIRDYVDELQETYVRGQQTGYEACADILDFIDHEILS